MLAEMLVAVLLIPNHSNSNTTCSGATFTFLVIILYIWYALLSHGYTDDDRESQPPLGW